MVYQRERRKMSILKKCLYVIVLLLVVVAIGACASTEPSVSPDEEGAGESQEVTTGDEAEVAPPAEPVTIRFQDWRLAEEPANTALRVIIDAFMAANPDVIVEYEPVSSGERRDKFVTQFRGGDPPNVVRGNITDVPVWDAMGALQPLDSFVEAAGGKDYTDLYTEYMIDAVTSDDHILCLPHEGDAFVLYVNRRMWEAAGLDPVNNPPQTFDDLREANLALTNATENQYAFGMLAQPGIADKWMQSWFTAFGSDFYNDDYSDTLIDTPKGIEAFTYYTDMFLKDQVVPPGALETNYAAQVTLMAQEQVGYIQGPYATYGGILAANPDLEPYLMAIPFPGTKSTAGRGTVWCIPSNSENQDAAWRLIEWMNTDDNMVQFFEQGSMLPTRKAALASIDLEAYPSAKVMVEDAIPVAGSYPVFAYYEECRSVIEDALSATLLGQVDAETAMKQAAEEIRGILSGG